MSLGRLWWAAIVLLGISVGAVGWTIWQLRNDAIRTAVSETGNIAAVLGGQLSRSLQAIDAVLLDVKRSQKALRLENAEALHAVYNDKTSQDSLKQHLAQLPHIFAIAIADETGQLVVSTVAWPTPDINIADRDYFRDARTRLDGQLSTSVPIQNRINGAETIVFARRLETSRGQFAGVVFASVNSSYFEWIYGSIQSVDSLIFTLVRQDGTILFRHPDGRPFAGDTLAAKSAWLDSRARGVNGFRIVARADGNVRYVSSRPVPEYPLFVNVSVKESAALAGWLQRSATIGLGSAALLLCSIYLLIAVNRQMRFLSASEASLKQKSHQLDAALNNMAQGLSMFDSRQQLVVCNTHFRDMYGLTPEQTAPGTPLRVILEARVAAGTNPQQQDYVATRVEQAASGESYCSVDKLPDGRVIAITRQPMSSGGWVANHQDITSQKRIEAELEHMARCDTLTGLANRAVFLEKINDALARLRRSGGRFSVLMLDLDRFKMVNDTLGHAIGDSLLKAMAERLRKVVREVDSVARLGGDEFAVLQASESDQPGTAIMAANRILQGLTEPYDLDGRKVIIGTSIGITVAPDDGSDADTLIRNADLALYKAKAEGRNCYRFFETSMQAEARDRRELEEDMRKAIGRDEFELHYQTVIDVEKRQPCGAEALVRWRHPERGLIYPDQFIHLAEESGLIVPLGAWILRRACADAAKWPANLRLAVNLSPVQFRQDGLLEVLASALGESGLDPKRLELEITESILVEKNEESLALLHELKKLGVSIVLDDFGIGYSSMRYLQMFPFDKIKIDKSFIQSMTSHSDSAAIVCAIAALGRSLDIETTAEGVETPQQFTFIRSAGCQLAQGYLFSRPVPPSELSFERPESLGDDVKAA